MDGEYCLNLLRVDVPFDKGSQRPPMLRSLTDQRGLRHGEVGAQAPRRQRRPVRQFATYATGVAEIATRRSKCASLPCLLKKGVGYSKSKLARVGMAIVTFPRVLVVGGYFTFMGAEQYLGGNRLRSIMNEPLQQFAYGY